MRILIISQHIFPMQTPRAHRTTELLKELGRRGHDVTLFAVLGNYDYTHFKSEFGVKIKNIPIRLQQHPYSSDADARRTLIDKVASKILGKVLEFPTIELMYQVPGIIKKEDKFDALITIADPHHIHWGAAKAKKKYPEKFPGVWIADCGDPFMLNGTTKDHQSYFAYFEKKFCSLCDYITVPIPEAKMGYYPEFRHKIRVIPQGFDFERKASRSNPENDKVTFAYAGTFYKDIRNPTSFLDFISKVDIDFRFIVYSAHHELVDPFKKILGDKLEIRKPLPRTLLLSELEQMDFLVSFENVNLKTQIPSKLIDYAIAGSPILSVNPLELDPENIVAFLNKDYTNRFTVDNLEQYHIKSVTDQFIDLMLETKEF